jgi:hypothetical protein
MSNINVDEKSPKYGWIKHLGQNYDTESNCIDDENIVNIE